MREAFDADERDYQNGLARAEALEHKVTEETDHFMKYEITPDWIEEYLMNSPEELSGDIHKLLLNGEDKFIGRVIRQYLWKYKYEELDEYYS